MLRSFFGCSLDEQVPKSRSKPGPWLIDDTLVSLITIIVKFNFTARDLHGTTRRGDPRTALLIASIPEIRLEHLHLIAR